MSDSSIEGRESLKFEDTKVGEHFTSEDGTVYTCLYYTDTGQIYSVVGPLDLEIDEVKRKPIEGEEGRA